MLSSLAPASLYHVDFVEAARFEETEGAATYPDRYSYTNTGPDTGSATFNYDDGDSCTYSVTFLSRTTGSLTYTCNDGTSGETNWRLVDDPDYAPVTPPETRTVEPESFSIPNLGGWSVTSNGTEADPRSGYGRIRAEAGSTTPSGIAMNDCSSAVAVFDGGPLPLFDLDMSRSVLHSPGLVLIRHETDGRRVTMFKGFGITTAPIAALVPVSLAVSARAQTAGSVYRLAVTIDRAPASCSTDDIVRISRPEGLFDGFTKSLPQSTPHRNAERREPMNSISTSQPEAEPSVPDRSGQHALPSPNQFLVRLAFRATALAVICGFPADIVATDPVTKSFADSQGRTTLYRYSLKDGWHPTQPRGLLVYFHGNSYKYQ